jgi:hypothetical protein
MPARDQPSSELRYPAPAEVFWCIASIIFPEAPEAMRVAIKAAELTSIALLESIFDTSFVTNFRKISLDIAVMQASNIPGTASLPEWSRGPTNLCRGRLQQLHDRLS